MDARTGLALLALVAAAVAYSHDDPKAHSSIFYEPIDLSATALDAAAPFELASPPPSAARPEAVGWCARAKGTLGPAACCPTRSGACEQASRTVPSAASATVRPPGAGACACM